MQIGGDIGIITKSSSKENNQPIYTAHHDQKPTSSFRHDLASENEPEQKNVDYFDTEYLEKQGSDAKNGELDKWAEERRRIEEILNGNYFGSSSLQKHDF